MSCGHDRVAHRAAYARKNSLLYTRILSDYDDWSIVIVIIAPLERLLSISKAIILTHATNYNIVKPL